MGWNLSVVMIRTYRVGDWDWSSDIGVYKHNSYTRIFTIIIYTHTYFISYLP